MKLKHAALIHSWAEGAKIEFFADDGKWHYTYYPSWHEQNQYRIKPSAEVAQMEKIFGTVEK